MGYAIVTSTCFGCKGVFSYNPHRVPSISIEGVREPVCLSCVEKVNPVREANGLALISLHPEAYQPIHEGEL